MGWLAANADAVQAGAAILSMLAIVCGAAAFIAAQYQSFFASRRAHHQYVMDLYRQFLDVALANPRLRLGDGSPADERGLDADDLYQRDVGFDMLTSMLELAFHTYAGSVRADRQSQWAGWDLYIRRYAARTDYQGWWLRVILGGNFEAIRDLEPALAENVKQLDPRFEAYILPIGREQFLAADEPKPSQV